MLELSWMIILELRDASSVIWFNWLAHLWNIKPLIIVYLEMEKSLKILNLKDKETDLIYRQSQSETAKLQAVKLLRQ